MNKENQLSNDEAAAEFRQWAEIAATQAEKGHWSNVWTIMRAELDPLAHRGSPSK